MVKMSRFISKAVVFAGLLAVSACASQFRSEVQSFHKFTSAPAGESFRIVPLDPNKQGSLEFETYANLVRAEMVRLGFKPVNAGTAADIDVKMGYSLSDPVEKIESRPSLGGYGFGGFGYGFYNSSFYSPVYYGHGGRYASAWGYDPFFGRGFGGDTEVYSYSQYTRKLNVMMSRSGNNEQLYDGKVESAGRDNRLPELMPYLVQSMFRDFPGQSGVTRRVVIDLPKK
jgi:Domain of unknown function (DUF4136)